MVASVQTLSLSRWWWAWDLFVSAASSFRKSCPLPLLIMFAMTSGDCEQIWPVWLNLFEIVWSLWGWIHYLCIAAVDDCWLNRPDGLGCALGWGRQRLPPHAEYNRLTLRGAVQAGWTMIQRLKAPSGFMALIFLSYGDILQQMNTAEIEQQQVTLSLRAVIIIYVNHLRRWVNMLCAMCESMFAVCVAWWRTDE